MVSRKQKSDKEQETKETKNNIKEKAKVIFVEIDDEVTHVFDALKKAKETKIILIVPKEASLFQSVINLKILKQKSDELSKTLQVITKDEIGLHLARQAGIVTSNEIDSSLQWNENINSAKEVDIKPIAASSNMNLRNSLKKLSRNKQTIFEILKDFRARGENSHRIKKIFSHFKKRPKILSGHKLSFSMPSTRGLSTLILMSIAVLIISAYIILPGATIYLTPKANVISQSMNVVLADSVKYDGEIKRAEKSILPMYFYETDISETMTYHATGKVFEGTNASGTIRIFNTSNNPWTLINNTRFQTSEGVVFRTKQYVTVPAKNADDTAGILDVAVIADELNIFAELVGEKGNIPAGTKFFIPALNEGNQKLIYGENQKAMTGGTTKFHEVITKEDVFAAQELIKTKIIENMNLTLKKEIENLNQKYSTKFYLILDDVVVKKDKIKVILPENIEGQSLAQFDLNGSMHVSVPYFNYDELLNIMKVELNKHSNPKKKLVKSYAENLQFEISEIDEKNSKIKITATLQGLEEFNLTEETETGKRIMEKIINNISGKSIDEANNYIQNLPEINKVEIVSWPKWALTIPSIPENIKIKIVASET